MARDLERDAGERNPDLHLVQADLGVLVVDEFNRDEPDAHQLKYYASGVGGVRVGWAGTNEEEQETLELVKVVHLDPDALAKVRVAALALEAHGYVTSKDVYGKTEPAQQR